MKKLVIAASLILVLIGSPLSADDYKTVAGEPPDKLEKKQSDVHLKYYGLRHIWKNGSDHSIGLYKITIGDLQKLNMALSLNKLFGFDGFIFTAYQDKTEEWNKIRVKRPVKHQKGWKVSKVIRKDMLPIPFNTMADDLLKKIHFIQVYPDNDNVMVVYIVEGTEYSDCVMIFDHICKKRIAQNGV
jgi:hypothetical protein